MVEVLVPSDRMGDVMSDLQNRRAMIEGMTSEKGFELITARVPLARAVSLFHRVKLAIQRPCQLYMKFHGLRGSTVRHSGQAA